MTRRICEQSLKASDLFLVDRLTYCEYSTCVLWSETLLSLKTLQEDRGVLNQEPYKG